MSTLVVGEGATRILRPYANSSAAQARLERFETQGAVEGGASGRVDRLWRPASARRTQVILEHAAEDRYLPLLIISPVSITPPFAPPHPAWPGYGPCEPGLQPYAIQAICLSPLAILFCRMAQCAMQQVLSRACKRSLQHRSHSDVERAPGHRTLPDAE
jgi:hypothetical protein